MTEEKHFIEDKSGKVRIYVNKEGDKYKVRLVYNTDYETLDCAVKHADSLYSHLERTDFIFGYGR